MPKISQLQPLAAIKTGSILPVVDGGVTQKVTVGKLYEFLSGTLDQTFATEIELMRSASQITSSIEILSASFDQRINDLITGEAQIPSGTVSSSIQIAQLGYAITGSNTFIGSQTITNGNSLYVNSISNLGNNTNIQIQADGQLSLVGETGGVQVNSNFKVSPNLVETLVVSESLVTVNGVPVITSSLQISEFGFVTQSVFESASASFDERIKNATNEQILDGFVLTSSFNDFSGSVHQRILDATNEQDLSYFATTGSNVFIGEQTITGSILISGSLIPNTGDGTFTSSFSLGSVTNAWKDIYVSKGSIVFVDELTQETSSFKITTDGGDVNTLKYSNGITASYYLGDGGNLTNLPSSTNWNRERIYTVRETEQLTFSGDYILENSYLQILSSEPASIGEWINVNPDDNDGVITRTGNNTYRIDGPNDDTGSGQIYIKRYFDTPTTMTIVYEWSNEDTNEDWPIYQITQTEPTGAINNTTKLENNNNSYETGSWIINVPANNWLAIGVYSTDSCCGSGSLNLTLPYIVGDTIQYAPNKYFKKEGSIFIGGNLLIKDSDILNNGIISVGGEVILIGNSTITGTGTII